MSMKAPGEPIAKFSVTIHIQSNEKSVQDEKEKGPCKTHYMLREKGKTFIKKI